MKHTLYKLLLTAGLGLLLITSAHADVSYEGYYISVAFILGVLFLPVVIVALTRRTRKKLYLAALILWAVAAFVFIWVTGGSQNEFFIISAVPYLVLAVYLLKEKKFARARLTKPGS